jgi:hypothetical protein
VGAKDVLVEERAVVFGCSVDAVGRADVDVGTSERVGAGGATLHGLTSRPLLRAPDARPGRDTFSAG